MPRPEPLPHVVVLGGSVAGLLVAAAAAGAGCPVTVLERDALPAEPALRPGVPHAAQPHVFLYRGLLALEELLPGLRAELLELGAVPFDTGDMAWLSEHGWSPTGLPAFEILSASRALVEHAVRARVAALPGVTIRTGQSVTGIRRTDRGWAAELDSGAEVAGDVLVDASGRNSRLPVWLPRAGMPAPRTSEVDARVGYATRTYPGPPDRIGTPALVVQANPETLAGGLALPVEGNRWLVTALGFGERRPPRDAGGFADFLDRLPDPTLAELARSGDAIGEVLIHRRTGNRRHHYERVARWPDGLLVAGDALCAFNPVYGHGVTVAACQALLLRRRLVRGPLRPGDSRRLIRGFARVAAVPWAVATGEDLRYPSSSGRQSLPQALLSRWAGEVGRLAAYGNPRAQATLARVYHLMGSPALLAHPGLVGAAVRGRVLGYGLATPRPLALPQCSGEASRAGLPAG